MMGVIFVCSESWRCQTAKQKYSEAWLNLEVDHQEDGSLPDNC